jgi:hypothetical protein
VIFSLLTLGWFEVNNEFVKVYRVSIRCFTVRKRDGNGVFWVKSTFQSSQVIENCTSKRHVIYHCKRRFVRFF